MPTSVRGPLLAIFLAFLSPCTSVAAALTGRVTDESGAAIPQAKALLVSTSNPKARYIASTNQEGVFRIAPIPAGDYRLEVLFAGFKPAAIAPIAITAAEDAVPRTFVLKVADLPVNTCGKAALAVRDLRLLPPGGHSGNIRGTVVFEGNRRPAHGVRVTLLCASGRPCGTAKTDGRGEYHFAALAPGTYGLTIAHPGVYPVSEFGLTVREDLEMVYRSVDVERCPKGNCDPKIRPSKSTAPQVCI